MLEWNNTASATPQPERPWTDTDAPAPAAQEGSGNRGSRGVTGLEEVEYGARRVTVDDKHMITWRADLNQLVPLKYKWAWQK